MKKLVNMPKLHIAVLMLLDLAILILVDGVALFVRFEFSVEQIPDQYIAMTFRYILPRFAVILGIFLVFHMYQRIWSNISALDVSRMFLTVAVACLVSLMACVAFGYRMPRSVYFLQIFLQATGFLGIRCAARVWTILRRNMGARGAERILLIGAGSAGELMIREALRQQATLGQIVCIVDDDVSKKGKYLNGIPIIGGREAILSAVQEENITQIVFAIPTASAQDRREILEICKQTPCKLRIIPGIYQLMNGEVSVGKLQDVQVEDLLGREPIRLELARLREFLQGRVVLVTGGGGSIGSELCRQIAKYSPKQLIILDIYENNAYEIQQELRRTYDGRLDLRVEIASVRDKEKMYELFARYKPDLVFHAAAHKHVPLMESCPSEAIKNNIFGTYHVIRAAEKNRVRKFIMISTDKAVNPTNVMGATKRFCEMILQSRQSDATEFCAVRFGNVLGSNGSVVPLFKRQIAEGGPVTITDRRIIRYFMTIPEAVQLVLEAGSMARSGEIFVLDMGEPVKILTLAENLIRLSGLEPYRDIDIVEVGLRPGEKLFEELLMSSEQLSATENKKIFIEQQRPLEREEIFYKMNRLGDAVEEGRSDEELIALLREVVPTFYLPEEYNRQVKE